ncbi:hypothetical protein ACH5RR_038803 [Cinchona calisaya]|uniref:AB hydrolase-1 domain-containing protein n=1 Tax=Cinchona calisaya TaxID=153742 RepID=A0ABD2Y0G6_9GENT
MATAAAAASASAASPPPHLFLKSTSLFSIKAQADVKKGDIVLAGTGIAGVATAVSVERFGIRSKVIEEVESLRYGGTSHIQGCKYVIARNIQPVRSSSISAPATPVTEEEEGILSLDVSEIKEMCRSWLWRGHKINYLIYPVGDDKTLPRPPPLLLVHGFGASVAHWRRNISVLSRSYTVYAIDLLGFGASDKPTGFAYSMEAWSQLILDFLNEVIRRPTVLIGNSVGSLACLIAATESSPRSLIRGLVLLNCAGGMNNKAIVDDWRIKLLLPLLWFFDFLLSQRWIASFLFNKVKQRDNIRNVLTSVYGNKESVDDDLVEIIRGPANDEGALDAFVSIVTGPPGPNPVQLIPNISLPILVLWGDQDPFTPLDGPVGKYFSSLPGKVPSISLFVLDGVGHCPHDDRPDLVHERLLPWLAQLPDLQDDTNNLPKAN